MEVHWSVTATQGSSSRTRYAGRPLAAGFEPSCIARCPLLLESYPLLRCLRPAELPPDVLGVICSVEAPSALLARGPPLHVAEPVHIIPHVHFRNAVTPYSLGLPAGALPLAAYPPASHSPPCRSWLDEPTWEAEARLWEEMCTGCRVLLTPGGSEVVLFGWVGGRLVEY